MDGSTRRLAARPLTRRSFLAAAGLGIGSAALAACSGGSASPTASAAASGGASVAPSTGEAIDELLMFNWSAYVSPDNIEAFKRQSGIDTFGYDTYANNEELIAKLTGGASGYDIAAPSAEYVPGMIQQGFIQKLDLSRIPNVKHIDNAFRGLPWDPTDEYQVPKAYGTTGILYRGKLVPYPPTSWQDLYDGITSEWSGKTVFVDSMSDVMVFPLKLLGYSLNSVDPVQLGEARQILLDVAPHILSLDSDTYQDRLSSEDAAVCLGWAGPSRAMRADPDTADTAYLVPSEGSLLWLDTWVILADAPNPNASYAWLDFIHRPEAQAEETNTTGYATPNVDARALVDPAILDDPAVFPPDDVMARLEGAQDTSGNDQRIAIWQEFKSKVGQG